jgi:hypothetical protein
VELLTPPSIQHVPFFVAIFTGLRKSAIPEVVFTLNLNSTKLEKRETEA